MFQTLHNLPPAPISTEHNGALNLLVFCLSEQNFAESVMCTE